MGLLTTLVTLPISGPIKGVAWTVERVAEAADQHLDDASAESELAELERRHAFGELSDDDYAREEEALWERLRNLEEHRDG